MPFPSHTVGVCVQICLSHGVGSLAQLLARGRISTEVHGWDRCSLGRKSTEEPGGTYSFWFATWSWAGRGWRCSDSKTAAVGENGVGHGSLGMTGVLPVEARELWLWPAEKPRFCEGTGQMQALLLPWRFLTSLTGRILG